MLRPRQLGNGLPRGYNSLQSSTSVPGPLPQCGSPDSRRVFARQQKIPLTENSIEYGDLVKFVDFRYLTGMTGMRRGYEVLYWGTIPPYWEWGIPADENFQITVPYSKDNVVYAVRAFDALGHPSLPVHPEPAPLLRRGD
jgi:hypothetical protein